MSARPRAGARVQSPEGDRVSGLEGLQADEPASGRVVGEAEVDAFIERSGPFSDLNT